MVKKKTSRFDMRFLPGDAALFRKARAKSGLSSNVEMVRLVLRKFAKGAKKK